MQQEYVDVREVEISTGQIEIVENNVQNPTTDLVTLARDEEVGRGREDEPQQTLVIAVDPMGYIQIGEQPHLMNIKDIVCWSCDEEVKVSLFHDFFKCKKCKTLNSLIELKNELMKIDEKKLLKCNYCSKLMESQKPVTPGIFFICVFSKQNNLF